MLHAHPPSACRRISGVTEGGSSVEGFSKTYRSTGVTRDVLRSRPSLEKERVKNPRICVAVVQDSEKCEKMSRPRYGFLRLVNGRPSLSASEIDAAVARLRLRPHHPHRFRLPSPLCGLGDGQGFRTGPEPGL